MSIETTSSLQPCSFGIHRSGIIPKPSINYACYILGEGQVKPDWPWLMPKDSWPCKEILFIAQWIKCFSKSIAHREFEQIHNESDARKQWIHFWVSSFPFRLVGLSTLWKGTISFAEALIKNCKNCNYIKIKHGRQKIEQSKALGQLTRQLKYITML